MEKISQFFGDTKFRARKKQFLFSAPGLQRGHYFLNQENCFVKIDIGFIFFRNLKNDFIEVEEELNEIFTNNILEFSFFFQTYLC